MHKFFLNSLSTIINFWICFPRVIWSSVFIRIGVALSCVVLYFIVYRLIPFNWVGDVLYTIFILPFVWKFIYYIKDTIHTAIRLFIFKEDDDWDSYML